MQKTTMSVKELSEQLGVSMQVAYQLTETPHFPVIKLGKRKIIPVEGYMRWLENSCGATFGTYKEGLM